MKRRGPLVGALVVVGALLVVWFFGTSMDGSVGGPGAGGPAPDPSEPPAAAPSPRPTVPLHSPTPGEHWRSGKTLATPCPDRSSPPAQGSLLKAGPVQPVPDGFRRPALHLRSGGRIDVRDGSLGFLGTDYLPDGPEDLTPVPRGVHPVTIAEVRGRTGSLAADGPDFAAAELRVSGTVPVRWTDDGIDVRDGATLSWFGAAAARRFLGAGFDPLEQVDDRGRGEIEVTSSWSVPCFFLDVAPRTPDDVHDVVVMIPHTDGWYRRMVGYDASGTPAAVVIFTGIVPWASLGLPGTPPPNVAG